MENEKRAGDNGASFADRDTNSIEGQSQYSTEPATIQPPNVFEAAALGRGSLTQKQLTVLDSLRSQMDSDQFNQFREAVGVPAWTANWRLSKRTAAALIRVILAEREAGQ